MSQNSLFFVVTLLPSLSHAGFLFDKWREPTQPGTFEIVRCGTRLKILIVQQETNI